MFVPQVPSPSRQITIGAVLSLLVFGALGALLHGCSASLSNAVVQCKLNAVERFIDRVDGDPMLVTPYDGSELVERVAACHAAADAGAR